jgi:hypothetical protein
MSNNPDKFHNRMDNKSDILQREELKRPAYTVPEGYFDTLSERVMQRVASDGKQHAGRTVRLNRWWMVAAAACVATAIVFSIRFNTPHQSDMTAMEEEESYLETYPDLMDLSAQTIAEMDDAEDTDDISQDAIIEYLAYNGLSGAYLYEQLAEAE